MGTSEKGNQAIPKPSPKFQFDDIVLCRYNGYPYWPAVIASPAKNEKYLCTFLNDNSAAWVEWHKIFKYHPDHGAKVSLPQIDPLKENLVAAISAADELWTKNGCPEKEDTSEDFKLCIKGNFLHPQESKFDQMNVDKEQQQDQDQKQQQEQQQEQQQDQEELCNAIKVQDKGVNPEHVPVASSFESFGLEKFDDAFQSLQAAVNGLKKYKSYVANLELCLESEINRRKIVEKELLKEKKTVYDLRKIVKSIRKVID